MAVVEAKSGGVAPLFGCTRQLLGSLAGASAHGHHLLLVESSHIVAYIRLICQGSSAPLWLRARPPLAPYVLRHRRWSDEPVMPRLDARDDPSLKQPFKLAHRQAVTSGGLCDGDVILIGQWRFLVSGFLGSIGFSD